MNTSPVTIVTSLYGTTHHQYIERWQNSIRQLTTQPEAVLIATDQTIAADCDADTLTTTCTWQHPQAYHLHQAINNAKTEWVWILDIDDQALPDALDGLAHVQADVWQMGYHRTDGETYIPPQMTATEYLNAKGNPFTGASAIWVDAFHDCGGFPDIAFQDFGLWRRLAHINASFKSSDRAHFTYNLHQDTRTLVELVPDQREHHLAELVESEAYAR